MPQAKFFETTFHFGGMQRRLYVMAYEEDQARDAVQYFYQIETFAEPIKEIARFEIPYCGQIINAIS